MATPPVFGAVTTAEAALAAGAHMEVAVPIETGANRLLLVMVAAETPRLDVRHSGLSASRSTASS